MSTVRPLAVFQAGALAVWAIVGVGIFTRVAGTSHQELARKAPPWLPVEALGANTEMFWLLLAALLLAFGLAFYANTRSVQDPPPRRSAIVLLVIQLLLALTLSWEFLFLVAAEVPFVLAGRAAFVWMGGQAALTVAAGLIDVARHSFEPMQGIGYLPFWLVVALTELWVVAWQGLMFVAGYLAATEARSRRELERASAQLLATQQLLAASSRVAERAHIARELHDAIGHHLTALSVNLELAKQTSDGRAAVAVGEAHAVARLLLADVREAVGALRGDRRLELRQALETLLAGAGPATTLSWADGLDVDDPLRAHVVFRVVQEAVTNAMRHARARTVRIGVAGKDGGIAVEVCDDGQGTEVVRPGIGLAGMRERVEEMGGRLELESGRGHGFTVRAWLPPVAEAG